MLYLMLPLILVICAYIIYYDAKKGIIRNRSLLALLALGIIYQLASGSIFTNTTTILFTLSYGFLVSFFFWWLGIWPGGDAKLFIVLFLLFPAQFYSDIMLPYLMNTFVPLFVFMMLYVLTKSRAADIKDALRYSLNPYKVSFIFIIVIGFMWFFTGLIRLAGINADYFITIVMIFLVYELFSVTISAKTEILFMALVLLRVIMDFQNLFTLASLYYFLLVVGAFIFFRFFLLHITYHTFTNQVKLENLRPGMILAEGICIEGKRYARISFLNSSLIEYMQQKKKRFIHSLDELTKGEVTKIKKLRKQGRIAFDKIRIYQTQPFAVFIILGYLLTLFLQGGLLS